ncbi:response regulator [Hymenobacter sp. UV11]|uniref:response regulator n=1 Tax=Hymenobacter sp. UV11 TaxID=1849735 RepID=UPI00105F2126|nr:response regulator [Hymenobacter sp. UV11]TDN36202.1 hypothetical protein A8B98_09750 [Hymenobacter sp. UV11]TFZ66904.1 response regulator [Hymenobacter sp. UV11]
MKKLSSVLLIDDDSTTNFLNNLLLKRLDIADTLLVAENGALGLAILAEVCAEATPRCPALILLDVNMPVMNGIEFLEAYQRLPLAQRQAIIIVLLTTSVHPRDLERVRQLPIAGTLNKPLTEEKMRGVLQQYFPD